MRDTDVVGDTWRSSRKLVLDANTRCQSQYSQIGTEDRETTGPIVMQACFKALMN